MGGPSGELDRNILAQEREALSEDLEQAAATFRFGASSSENSEQSGELAPIDLGCLTPCADRQVAKAATCAACALASLLDWHKAKSAVDSEAAIADFRQHGGRWHKNHDTTSAGIVKQKRDKQPLSYDG